MQGTELDEAVEKVIRKRGASDSTLEALSTSSATYILTDMDGT